MYNHLTKEDIFDIIDKIQISQYYKKKLRKINDIGKLRKEFSKLLTKYDKFLKQKKQIKKLILQKNKIKKHYKNKIQKGGNKSQLNTLKDELKLLLSDIDNISVKKTYLDKIALIEKMIMELKKKKISDNAKYEEIKNANKSLEDLRNKLMKQSDKESQTKLADFEKLELSPSEIKKLVDEKNKLLDEINTYKQLYTKLENDSKENIEKVKLEMDGIIEEEKEKYEDQITNLNKQKIDVENKLKELEKQLLENNNVKTKIEQQLQEQNTNDYNFSELNAKLKECNDKNLKLTEEQGDINTLKIQLNNALNNIEELKEKNFSKDKQYELLQKEKAKVRQEMENITNEIMEKEMEIKELKKKNNELQNNMQNVQKNNNEKIKKLEEEKQAIENNTKLLLEKQKEREELLKKELELKQQEKINQEIEEQEKIKDIKEKEDESEKKEEEIKEKEVKIPKENVLENLKNKDFVQYIIKSIENIKQNISFYEENNLSEDEVLEKVTNDLKVVEKLHAEINNETIDLVKQIISQTTEYLPSMKKEDYERFDGLKIVKDKDDTMFGGRLFGGARRRKFYGGSSINQIKKEINFNYTEIINKKIHNYNFAKQILIKLKDDIKNYNNTTSQTRAKSITEKLPKGVINLYIRLIENIMNYWEMLDWGKLSPEMLKEIDLEQQNNFVRKIKQLSEIYKKPNFNKDIKLDTKLQTYLKEIYEQHYLLIRRWFRILKNLSKRIRADQSLNIMESSKELRIEFNSFDILRDILDKYQLLIRKPVSVYARINDIGRDESGFENTKEMCLEKDDFICKKVKNDDYVMFSIFQNPEYENYLNINIDQCNSIQKLKKEKPEIFKKVDRVSRLENATKFDEIFFSAEFSNNKTISRYMLLDKLIENGIGIFLVTYGYSGTGKSYTLFGHKDVGGLLQSTIENIKNIKKTKMRIYEIYGRTLPYSDGYNDLKQLDQDLVYYNMKISDTTKGIILKDNATSKTDDIQKYIKSDKGFIYLPQNKPRELKKSLQSISDLVNNIEIFRQNSEPRRVKPTVNNPQSSRSILIYDFVFTVELEGGVMKDVSFVIDDMPGLEDPIKTYVTENKKKIIFGSGNNFDYFYECVNPNKQIQKIKNISRDRTLRNNNIVKYFEKYNFINELEYLKYPIQYYQELLLMSSLLNPLYISLLKPNDMFGIFNKYKEGFRSLVLSKFKNKDQFTINEYKKFEMESNNKMQNSLLNLQNKSTVKITAKVHDKELINSSVMLMKSIIESCIETNDMNPLVKLIAQILYDEKIPSDPLLKMEDIQISQEEYNKIFDKFQRSILSNFIMEWIKSNQGIRFLQLDKLKIYKLSDKLIPKLIQYFIEDNNQKFFRIIGIAQLSKKQPKKLLTSIDQIIDKMLRFDMVKSRIRNVRTYGDYIKYKLETEGTIKDAFEKAKEIKLYETRKNIIYENPKMKKTVNSFVNVAFEAWYINQNIAGILKYYSLISDINPNIINTYVSKQNVIDTSLNKTTERVLKHLNTLFDSEGKLINLEINYYKIFCEIKNNTNVTGLFQTQKQERENKLIVKDIIDPYADRIQDFKMFYVLQNNNSQLKCIKQYELFMNTRKFINNIGQK